MNAADALVLALGEIGVARDEFPALPKDVMRERLIRAIDLRRDAGETDLPILGIGYVDDEHEEQIAAMES